MNTATNDASVLRHRLQEVDVLRGCAALWVLFSHYLPNWSERFGPTLVIVPNAYGLYAVQLFFVISGFVIFVTLDRCKTLTDFFVLRFSRLYPTYWVTLIFVTLISVWLFGEKFWWGGLLTNLTMFQEFIHYPDHDVVYWSLAIELVFYLNAAWLFSLGWHRHPQRIVIVWLIAALVWALVVHPVRRQERDWFATLFALDYAPYFSIGILFFDAMKRGWSAFATLLIAFAIGVDFAIAQWAGVCVAASVTLLFLAAIRGYLRFMVSKPTLWLGAISYSLYLVHRNLGYETLNWLHLRGVGVVAAVSITIAGALLLATLVTYCVEQPALKHIRAWYESR